MIAKICGENDFYYSVVLAYKNRGFNSKMVVLNESYDKLIVIDYWSEYEQDISRNIYLINNDKTNFKINTKKFGCLWDNKDIFKMVKKNMYSEEMLNQAKELQEKIEIKEWNKIENREDILNLKELAFSFRDATILNIEQHFNDVLIHIDTSWDLHILLKCEGVVENNIFADEDISNLFEGIVKIEDEFTSITFIKDTLDKQLKEYGITAKKISYKLLVIQSSLIDIKNIKYTDEGFSIEKGKEQMIFDFKQLAENYKKYNEIHVKNKHCIGESFFDVVLLFYFEKYIVKLVIKKRPFESYRRQIKNIDKLHQYIKDRGYVIKDL